MRRAPCIGSAIPDATKQLMATLTGALEMSAVFMKAFENFQGGGVLIYGEGAAKLLAICITLIFVLAKD